VPNTIAIAGVTNPIAIVSIAVVSIPIVSVAIASVAVVRRRRISGGVSRGGIAIAAVSRGIAIGVIVTIVVGITVAIAVIGGGECGTSECTCG
jgi:hypothetical protein